LEDIIDSNTQREKKICGNGREKDGWKEDEKCSTDEECWEEEGDEETYEEAGNEGRDKDAEREDGEDKEGTAGQGEVGENECLCAKRLAISIEALLQWRWSGAQQVLGSATQISSNWPWALISAGEVSAYRASPCLSLSLLFLRLGDARL